MDETSTTTSKPRAVNITLKWTDNKTDQETTLSWCHISCTCCETTLNTWTAHVRKGHRSRELVNVTNTVSASVEVPLEKEAVEKFEKCDRGPGLQGGKQLKQEHPTSEAEVLDVLASDENNAASDEDNDASDEENDSDYSTYQLPTRNSGSKHYKNNQKQRKPPKATQKQRRSRRKVSRSTRSNKSYRCRKQPCEETFLTLKDRREHESAHKEVQHPFKCQQLGCKDSFTTQKALAAHSIVHLDKFECRIESCGQTFDSKPERLAHEKMHKHFCRAQNCDKVFDTRQKLHDHLQEHKGSSAFICGLCGKTFQLNKYLTKHMKTHKSNNLQCEMCDKVFKNEIALSSHQRLHTGEGLLVCQYCGKKINGKGSLDRHERLHTGVKPYKCRYCDKGFISGTTRTTHEQEHTGYQFVCSHCGSGFKTKAAMIEHERVHTGEAPLQCKICNVSFKSASRLWAHNRVHTSERYKCDVCNKEFEMKSKLRRHKAIHSDMKQFECQHCKKRFSQSSGLNGHVRQVHLGIKRMGHQGRAKRLKEEAKRLLELEQRRKDAGESSNGASFDAQADNELTNRAKLHTSLHVPMEAHLNQSSNGSNLAGGGNHETSLYPQAEPKDLSKPQQTISNAPKCGVPDSKLAGSPIQAHSSNRSNFYTMVESLIQFSEEH